MSGQKKQLDPLYQLFEHHLLTRSYEDSAAFTKEVAKEYLSYIDSTLAHVPLHVRANVVEDLEAEAHELLVKKMYGVVNSTEHMNFGKVVKVENRKERLSTFEFFAPVVTEDTSNNTPKKD